MPTLPRVGLLIQSSLEYGRGLLRGVGQYIAEQGPWAVYHRSGPLLERLPSDFRAWRPDAILAQLESPTLARQIRAMKRPTVDLYAMRSWPGIPRLMPDQQAVARLVADYFLERGYEHFAYCGFQGVYYCELRCRYFVEYLTQRGLRPAVYEGRLTRGTRGVFDREAAGLLETDRLGLWLQSLPKPLAVMAGSDVRAQQVLGACSEYGMPVPDTVAVTGVSNDEVLCRICHPQLTSVDLNTEEIGYQAAATLHRMMRGGHAPEEPVLIAPRGIVARESTRALAISDAEVVAAMQFIQEHACEGISVDDVVRHVVISRSTLQRRFAAALGRTLQTQIHWQQVQRVKQLLADTDRPLSQIAEMSGFGYTECMCRVFKRLTRQTPGAYRKSHFRRARRPGERPA